MDSRGHSRSAISRGQSRSDVVASSAATHTSTGSSRPVTVCKPNSRHQRRQWQAIPTTPPFVRCLRRGFMSFVRPIWRPRVTLKWGPGRCPSAAFVSVSPHPLESIIRRCLTAGLPLHVQLLVPSAADVDSLPKACKGRSLAVDPATGRNKENGGHAAANVDEFQELARALSSAGMGGLGTALAASSGANPPHHPTHFTDTQTGGYRGRNGPAA
jgi:hypothetical protein